MDTRIIKAAVALGLVALAVMQFIAGNIWNGIFLVLAAAIVGLLFFRSIRMLTAFYFLRKNDMAKANDWLAKVNPSKLFKAQEAYYYFLSGICNMESNSMTQTEKTFKKALSLGLKQDHDKAMAKLNLAQIALAKRRKRDALNLLAEVKKLDKRNMLREQVKMIKDASKRF